MAALREITRRTTTRLVAEATTMTLAETTGTTVAEPRRKARRGAAVLGFASLAAGAFFALMPSPVAASEPSVDAADDASIDRLSLAALMMKDGHLDRAAAVLAEIDVQDEDLDRPQYFRISGLVAFKRGLFPDAAQHFRAAIEAGDTKPATVLLLAQSELNAEMLDAAAETIRKAPALVRAQPESYLLEAMIQYRRQDKHASFEALDAGFRRFPTNREMAQRRAYLLVDLGLYQAAVEAMTPLLDDARVKADDFIAFADALRNAGELERATLLLEGARLRFPGEQTLSSELALTYLRRGRPLTAAELLMPAALIDGRVALQAAELYRQARRFDRATWMNGKVDDQKEKIRQRLSLLIEQEHHEAAASLDARLDRLGLLDDEPVLYALAYAHFMIREYDRAELLLGRLQDPELFRKANALRRLMASSCVDSDPSCQ